MPGNNLESDGMTTWKGRKGHTPGNTFESDGMITWKG